MVPIGEMRHTGAFQTNSPTSTATGGKVDAYTTVLSTRGRLRKLRGSRGINAGQVEREATYEFICRFQDGFTDIKSARWVIEGEYYSITDYEVEDFKNKFYKFILVASE